VAEPPQRQQRQQQPNAQHLERPPRADRRQRSEAPTTPGPRSPPSHLTTASPATVTGTATPRSPPANTATDNPTSTTPATSQPTPLVCRWWGRGGGSPLGRQRRGDPGACRTGGRARWTPGRADWSLGRSMALHQPRPRARPCHVNGVAHPIGRRRGSLPTTRLPGDSTPRRCGEPIGDQSSPRLAEAEGPTQQRGRRTRVPIRGCASRPAL
jgi:hypothetical protein